MMRMKTKVTEMSRIGKGNLVGGGGNDPEKSDWELRPGGMLVQKRNPDSDRESVPAPTIRVKVKHGSSYHEIYISSQASFGELKKLLAAPTGLHPQDQKLFFKDKERDSKAFLDIVGVKDRSKIVLVEDPTSQERRYLEMRKNAKMERASKTISEISMEVDKLAGQVSALESVISRGGKVAETEVLNLIETLMNQLIKLDGIIADGDVKMQRRMQVRRVQKYVETLDMLKLKNSITDNNGSEQQRSCSGQIPIPIMHRQQRQTHSTGPLPTQIKVQQPQQTAPSVQQDQMFSKHSPSGAVVVSTKWETFDSSSLPPVASATSTSTVPPRFNWEFFD